jgi:hypothetical protein
VEAFLKGPVAMTARVIRAQGQPEEAALPLFQVPVLHFQDQLELSFAGEAFDRRITDANWSLIVVFLPKTVAPTDQGVVSYPLKRKDAQMRVPVIPVPYDSIPMIFLIPDSNGRKKVLKDLNAHLESFRTLCAKIADLSAERSTVDKFVEDLNAIDKTMSPAQYDNAVLGFMHTYGVSIGVDAQAFASTGSSNLVKCQFLSQEFQRTNVLVPDPAAAPVAAQAAVVTGPERAASAYVSIFFDVATIIANLWPGHQFQYLPVLGRNFHGASCDLYYTDWIHTTGDTLGALMCCPGKWEDQGLPAFDLELPRGESMLAHQALFRARPKEKGRSPFPLYGHDWKLLVTGPKGESLAPVPLSLSPNRESFVAPLAALQEPLRKLGAMTVKVRIVGRWGFTSIATEPLEVPVACDPAWVPSAAEKTAFQIGRACAFKLPGTWSGAVERVSFRHQEGAAKPLVAKLREEDGGILAVFEPGPDAAGAGTLEIKLFGSDKPALAQAITLRDCEPECAGLEVRLHETSVVMTGKHLAGVEGVELGKRLFHPAAKDAGAGGRLVLVAADGKGFEGAIGSPLPAVLITAAGRTELPAAPLQAARPRLLEATVTAMALKGSGLPVTCGQPVAAAGAPSLISLVAAKGYRFPADGAFHVLIRNPEEPSEQRPIPAGKFKVMGNNQKATFILLPADLMGGRASGRLEVQLHDDHAGASDWLPLPATFLDLPVITLIQAAPAGSRLVGPSLDPVEAVAATPQGPWEKVGVRVEEGREAMDLSTALAGTCYLKVFGWPDLVLAVRLPAPIAKPAPAEPPAKTEEPAANRIGSSEAPPAPTPAPAT